MNLFEASRAIEEIEDFVSSFLDDGSGEYYFPNDSKLDEPGVRRIIKLISDEKGDLNIIFEKKLYMERPCSTYIPENEKLLRTVDSVSVKDQIEQAKILSQLILSTLLVLNYGGTIYSGNLGSMYENNKINKKAANQFLSMIKSMTTLDPESERNLIRLLSNSEPDIEELINFFASRVKPSEFNSGEELDRFFIPDAVKLALTRFVNHCDYLIGKNNGQDNSAPSV